MLYHVSKDSKLKFLTPKVPDGATAPYENKTIKRVCFSESIEGCLSAIDPISTKRYFVYTPVGNDILTYKPNVIEVRDVKYTGEVWRLDDVQVKLLGEIKVDDYNKVRRYNSGRGRVAIRNYPFNWV